MKNKILLCIADGIGDRPCEVLGWKTPLQYANTPHLDQLAKDGQSGIMDLYQAGTPVGTDLGHMYMFGYDLKDYLVEAQLKLLAKTLNFGWRCGFSK